MIEEFEGVNLGDKRVNTKCLSIVDTLANRPGATIPTACDTWSETKCCYEFFANGKVTPEKLLEPHKKATIKRIQKEQIVLLPTDTSSLNLTSKPSIKSLGNIGNVNQGIFIHPLLAITPDRVNLGIVDANIWARESNDKQLSGHEIYALPIEEKEKYRWIESYKIACEVANQCPDTQVIAITDREGDFAELFEAVNSAQKEEKYADIIVRSYHDRTVVSDGETKKLKKALEDANPLGTITFTIPKTKNREARVVVQALKAAKVTFKKRSISKSKASPLVTMNAVMAIEENPPEGVEPLIWVFLTTLPIDTFEQGALVIKYYLARWEIEVFFKILKSGCAVEKRRLSEYENLASLMAIYLVIAWRIAHVTKLARTYPEISCEAVFSRSEWQAAHVMKKKNNKFPDKAPTLAEFICIVATLGGYLNRKNDPPPGPTVIWTGLTRLHDFTTIYETICNLKND